MQKLEEAKRNEEAQLPEASEDQLFGDDEDTVEDLFAGIPKTTAASTTYVGSSELSWSPALCICTASVHTVTVNRLLINFP